MISQVETSLVLLLCVVVQQLVAFTNDGSKQKVIERSIRRDVHSDFVATVLDVRRERLPDNRYSFTLRYIPHAQDLRVSYVNETVESNDEVFKYLHGLIGTPGPDGVMRVTVVKDFVAQPDQDKTFVYFTTEAERVGIRLFMSHGEAGNLYSRVQPWPFTVSTGQLVYQAGSNTDQFSVNWTASSNNMMSSKIMTMDLVMLNLGTRKATIESFLDHSSYFETSISTKYGSRPDKTVQGELKTSRYRMAGYVDVRLTENFYSNSSAVRAIEVKKKIAVHPAHQTGVFPNGYVGFAVPEGSKRGYGGKQIFSCDVTDGSLCREIVHVLSQDATQLSCNEILDDGTKRALEVTTPANLQFYSDVRKYMFTVEPSSDRQSSSNVKCRVTSNSNSYKVKEFKVYYFVQPQILLHKSSVQIGDNVTVTCTVTGNPLPRLHVVVNWRNQEGWGNTYFHNIATDSTVTSSDGQEVRGIITLPLKPLHSLASVNCGAQTSINYRGERGNQVRADVAFAEGFVLQA